MLEASKKINADLAADAPLQQVISDNHFWELADDNAKVPFVTFSIRENKRGSKDRRGNYDVTLRSFAKNLTEAAILSDLVRSAMEDKQYRYLNGESGYVDSEAREAYIELNFNFNL